MGIPGEVTMKAEKSDISFGILEGVTIIYGLGFGLLFTHFLYSHFTLQGKMRGAKKKADGIYIGKSIELPFSYGILNKRIYLPLGLSSEEQAQIVAHERVHIKRQDPLIKMGAYFILLVHWFNPILWLSYILMTKDMEMSCDERALEEASKEEKYVYAKVLLRISEEAPKSLPATAYSLGDVGQRLKNIFSFQKTNRKEKVVFSFILFLMLALLLTNPLVKVTENVDRFNQNIIVDGLALPFYESTIHDKTEVIESKLILMFDLKGLNVPEDFKYIIVNQDGKDLTDEFDKEAPPTYEEISNIAERIQENGYHIVNENTYRVTTLKKEITALFNGKRNVAPSILDKILDDNKELYENEDYEAINLYLIENKIAVTDNVN